MRRAGGVLIRKIARIAAVKHEITASVKIVVDARRSSRYRAHVFERRRMNFSSYRYTRRCAEP